MNAAKFRPCPVCGERWVQVLHTVRLELPAEFQLPDTFDLVCCVSCGMAFSDTTSDSQRLTSYYGLATYEFGNWADQPRAIGPAADLGSPLDVVRLRQAAAHVSALVPDIDVRVLDVGCASGSLMALLASAGFTDVQGIDPSAAAVARARAYGRRAQVGDLGLLPSDLGAFDLVTVTHVLEHLGNPREALLSLRTILRPGALVYAEVPDASRYGEWLVEPFNDLNIEHINHFSARHLDDLMRASGFELVAAGRNDFQLGNDWPYPAIYGMWRRLDVVPDDPIAGDGGELRDRLLRYVEGSIDQLAQLDDAIASALGDRRQVAVRCLGYRAWIVLGATMLRDLDVLAYIDADPGKQALTIRGMKATGPQTPLPSGLPVVVLAYHAEQVVLEEYAVTDPTREVLTLGRSRPPRHVQA